jgi:predicted DCC family thiol-disulfide oxidoreductase YuxK
MTRPARGERDVEPSTEPKRDASRVGFDPILTGLSKGAPVMVFDGACNLCHGWVRFALKRDRKARLKFLAAQAPHGQDFLKRHELPALNYDSFYLVENAVILHKSRGFLALVQYLCWPWPWLAVFSVLPSRLLDRPYDLIARNRYRWFGRREVCLIADEARAERFL